MHSGKFQVTNDGQRDTGNLNLFAAVLKQFFDAFAVCVAFECGPEVRGVEVALSRNIGEHIP